MEEKDQGTEVYLKGVSKNDTSGVKSVANYDNNIHCDLANEECNEAGSGEKRQGFTWYVVQWD